MNRSHHISALLVGCLLMVLPAVGQAWTASGPEAFKRDARASQHKYGTLEHMRQTTHIDTYLTGRGTTPHQRNTSVLWRMGGHYRLEHMGFTTFQDGEVRVVVDQEQHQILVSAPQDPMAAMHGALQDSLLALLPSIGRSAGTDGVHYRLKFAGMLGFDVVEVFFDREGWMRRVTLHWAQAVELLHRDPTAPLVLPRVVMEFGLPERVAAGSVNADPHTVVERRTEGLVAIGAWKGYEVFDTRLR